MFVRIHNSMGGMLDSERIFIIEPNSIVDYSHDPAEAQRLVDRNIAEEIGKLKAAELQAAGQRIFKHPLAGAKRK